MKQINSVNIMREQIDFNHDVTCNFINALQILNSHNSDFVVQHNVIFFFSIATFCLIHNLIEK